MRRLAQTDLTALDSEQRHTIARLIDTYARSLHDELAHETDTDAEWAISTEIDALLDTRARLRDDTLDTITVNERHAILIVRLLDAHARATRTLSTHVAEQLADANARAAGW